MGCVFLWTPTPPTSVSSRKSCRRRASLFVFVTRKKKEFCLLHQQIFSWFGCDHQKVWGGCHWYQPGGPRAHHALQLPLLCHRRSALFPINALRRWSWGNLIEMAHRESHPGARFFSDPNEFLGRGKNGGFSGRTQLIASFDCRPTVFQIIKPPSFPSGRPYPSHRSGIVAVDSPNFLRNDERRQCK